MKTEQYSKTKPTLAAYLNYTSEEALNLDRYVEHGARMLGRNEPFELVREITLLRKKISSIRNEHPQLARQLEFLIRFFESNPPNHPDTIPDDVHNETVFALRYAVKETDLMPDDMPEVGYLDDAAVVASVLSRHAIIFQSYCAVNGIQWVLLRPDPSN